MTRWIGLDFGASQTVILGSPGRLPDPVLLAQDPRLRRMEFPSSLVRQSRVAPGWRLPLGHELLNSQIRLLPSLKRLLFSSRASETRDWLDRLGFDIQQTETEDLCVAGTPLRELASVYFREVADHWQVVPPGAPPLTLPEMVAAVTPAFLPVEVVRDFQTWLTEAFSAPVRLISEAEAAALVYSFRRAVRKGEKVAFVGVGASVIWTAVVYFYGESYYEIISESGCIGLGVDGIDEALALLLLERAAASAPGWTPGQGQLPGNWRRLQAEAAEARLSLARQDVVEAQLPFAGLGSDGRPIHFRLSLSRPDLTLALASLLNSVQDVARQTLETADLTVYDIDRLVLTGGLAQLPEVNRLLTGSTTSGGVFGRQAEVLAPESLLAAAGALLYAARGNTTETMPYPLHTWCGEQFPRVLHRLKSNLWPAAVSTLTNRRDLHALPPEVQARLVQAAQHASLDAALETYRNQGETGLQLLAEGKINLLDRLKNQAISWLRRES